MEQNKVFYFSRTRLVRDSAQVQAPLCVVFLYVNAVRPVPLPFYQWCNVLVANQMATIHRYTRTLDSWTKFLELDQALGLGEGVSPRYRNPS